MRIKTKLRPLSVCLLVLVLVLAAVLSLGIAPREAQAANIGKRVLADYDALDGIATTEESYPSGIMIEATAYEWISPIFENDSVKKNWESAYYVMFYADNKLASPNAVGITLNSAGRQWIPKIGATDLMYYDDMGGTVMPSTIVDVHGGRTGITLPAHFRGYVKLKLRGETGTNDAFVTANFSHPSWDASKEAFDITNMWQLNYTGANIYVDTLTVSFDNDMMTALTPETANFGRGEAQATVASGKKIVADFMEGGVASSEGPLSNNMLALLPETYEGNPFGTYLAKDWSKVHYFLFWADNAYDKAMGAAIVLMQSRSIDVRTGRSVYLQTADGTVTEVKTVAVGGGYNGVMLPAGFRGYVKVPFDAQTFSGIDIGLPLTGIAFYAPTAKETDDALVCIDSVIVSFDDDITSAFDGILSNRPRTDFTGDESANDFWVIPNFIEQSYQNAYFDGYRAINPANTAVKPGEVVNTGKVTYNEEVSEMTVEHTAAAAGVSMWGYDYCMRLGQEDWTDAAFVVSTVKNETGTADKFVLMLAAENAIVSTGATYYLVDRIQKTVTTVACTGNGELLVPARFDGFIVIPKYSFPSGFHWNNVTRFSFMFTATAGTITFGRQGKATSAKILFPNDFALNIVDESNYFVMPEPQPLPSYPDRDFNEPQAGETYTVTEAGKGCASSAQGTTAAAAVVLFAVGAALLCLRRVARG